MKKIDINKVAQLAKINLKNDQKKRFTSQLEGILDLFEKINKVNTEQVEETSQVTGLYNVATSDAVISEDNLCSSRSQILRNTPRKEGNLIVVPKVIGDN